MDSKFCFWPLVYFFDSQIDWFSDSMTTKRKISWQWNTNQSASLVLES